MKNNKKITKTIIATIMIITVCIVVIIINMTRYRVINNKVDIEPVLSQDESQDDSAKDGIINEDKKINIIDVNSKTRPYAISINNTPVAVKVQTGLNKAYLVYEIPTEGNTSRLLALFKDINEDLTIGTIRSSRHNFIDLALESNAILVHYGWSHYAADDEKSGSIDYINGLFDKPFWRDNPANLASEHTAYTSINKLDETACAKNFKIESEDTILLNYSTEDIDLSNKESAQKANMVTIPYGSSPNITTFEYDASSKMYNRLEDGEKCIDEKTKEEINTKNIIIQKINYKMCGDNYYWDLETIGEGKGFYLTNGYMVPINWKKESRSSKTKYYYEDGNEIAVNDGRTYIELQTNSQKLNIGQ